MSLYNDLGVDENANQKDIKKAYRDKAKEHHPDKGGDKDKFAIIAAAYNILGDEKKRKEYDRTGEMPERNSLEEKAAGLLFTLFKQILEKDIQTFIYTNVMQLMKECMSDSKNQARKIILGMESDISFLKKARNRIAHKEDENIFSSVIDAKISEREFSIKEMEEAVEVGETAKDMLEQYDFMFDKTNPYNSISMAFGMDMGKGESWSTGFKP